VKIGILGTRGIPNYHGGFEQFAEFFATFLAEKGHEVYVYSSHMHPYQESTFQGANIIHCKDPEEKIGTVGQFLYDFNCILDARKRDFDILLQLGYTSNSVWHFLLPSKPTIITNMDGLEWKRSKYNKWVRKFLKFAEAWAVKSSDYLIADSIGIQNYLRNTYQKSSKYIAYGAELFKQPDLGVLENYGVKANQYNLLIARMEPENNIETILDGAVAASENQPFLVIGKHDVNSFGAHLKEKYKDHPYIKFVGGLYNQDHLNNLRYFSRLYFHGHSVGGTNPSLLEAMASNTLIIAHRNEFNGNILNDDAFYFESATDVARYIDQVKDKTQYQVFLDHNKTKIEQLFSWASINQQYLDFFKEVHEKSH
jgi:glycosyltransferase involved in cell wall biosynthesis